MIRILLLLTLCVACATPKVTFRHDLSEKKLQKLCFIGDMGDGSDTQKKVAHDLKKENCHHIFVLGDVIYTNGIHSEDDPALKERFIDIYEPIAKSGNKPRFSVVLG